MNTLYTIEANGTRAMDIANTDRFFVSGSRFAAEEVCAAFRRYNAAMVFTGEVTGAWSVVEHKDFAIGNAHNARVSAVRELNAFLRSGYTAVAVVKVPGGYAVQTSAQGAAI